GVMKKDFDHEDWKGRHKDQFNELIASARARRSVPSKERGEASTGESSSLQDSKMAIDDSILETSTPPNDHHPPAAIANDNTISKDSTLKETPSNDQTPPASIMFSSATNAVQSPDATSQVSTHTPSLGGSPEKLKKVPLFQVPEDPIID